MKQNIIVTGASRGIGLELVKILSQKHNVLAISRNIEQLKYLPNINELSLDFSQSNFDAVGNYVKSHWNKVDIVIHNAGKLINKPFSELSPKDFYNVYQVNVFAVAELTRVLLPFFQKGSHVLNISSMGGIQGSSKFPGLAAYSSSKGALITLTEVLAEEYKSAGISFNALALGSVQTEMLQEAFPGFKAITSAEEMAQFIADFALNGNKLFNGKVLQVANSTP